MIYKLSDIKRIVLPYKKVNIFVISVLFLGVIAGAVFSTIINNNDQMLVIEKIKLFIDNINNNSLNSITVLKNSLSVNLIYVLIIWFFGMALLGIILNTFLLFVKGFVFSFSISSFIITFKYKGILLSFLYLIFGQLLNILVLIVLTTYSIMFSYELILLIFKNSNGRIKKTLKNYFIIFSICLIISVISSLSETFLLPALIKLIIKLYL